MLVVYVPPLQEIFHTVGLGILDWIAIVLMATTVLIAEEILKVIMRKYNM